MPAEDFAPGRSDVRQFDGGRSLILRIADFRESNRSGVSISLASGGWFMGATQAGESSPGYFPAEAVPAMPLAQVNSGSGGHLKRLFVLQDRGEEDTGERSVRG